MSDSQGFKYWGEHVVKEMERLNANIITLASEIKDINKEHDTKLSKLKDTHERKIGNLEKDMVLQKYKSNVTHLIVIAIAAALRYFKF